jgi:hypothetical protein
MRMPSTRTQTGFRIDDDIMEGLKTVKERDGVPISEQVRRALREWLRGQGVITGSTRSKRGRQDAKTKGR